jgi:hypothetical protein
LTSSTVAKDTLSVAQQGWLYFICQLQITEKFGVHAKVSYWVVSPHRDLTSLYGFKISVSLI